MSGSGKQVAARKQGNACSCTKKCFSLISAVNRKKIFDSFNEMANKEVQDAYISSLITTKNKRQTRPRKENPKNRQFTFIYKVRIILAAKLNSSKL